MQIVLIRKFMQSHVVRVWNVYSEHSTCMWQIFYTMLMECYCQLGLCCEPIHRTPTVCIVWVGAYVYEYVCVCRHVGKRNTILLAQPWLLYISILTARVKFSYNIVVAAGAT